MKTYRIKSENDPNKFYLIPWDFDGSFGQKGSTEYDPYENPNSEILKVNELYARLLNNEEFMRDCSDRWKKLREELWTNEFISDLLTNFYEDIKDILNYEMIIWEPKGYEEETEKNFNFEEYIEALYRWIPNRLEFCDLYFAYLI